MTLVAARLDRIGLSCERASRPGAPGSTGSHSRRWKYPGLLYGWGAGPAMERSGSLRALGVEIGGGRGGAPRPRTRDHQGECDHRRPVAGRDPPARVTRRGKARAQRPMQIGGQVLREATGCRRELNETYASVVSCCESLYRLTSFRLVPCSGTW